MHVPSQKLAYFDASFLFFIPNAVKRNYYTFREEYTSIKVRVIYPLLLKNQPH